MFFSILQCDEIGHEVQTKLQNFLQSILSIGYASTIKNKLSLIFYCLSKNFWKLRKSSSGASLLSISFQHVLHLCLIMVHLFFFTSIPTGRMIHPHVDNLSHGYILSKCLLCKHWGQWFLALPLGCFVTLFQQFSQSNESLIILKLIAYIWKM